MVMNRELELIIGHQDQTCRLDAYVARITGLSRSLMTEGSTVFIIDGNTVKKSQTAREGQKVLIKYCEMLFEDIVPQDIPLDVIYEDHDILVIDKPQGMVVHPALGNYEGTLVNALAFRYGDDFLKSMEMDGDISRPGIVHRLDKDTSGVMVVALNRESHAALSRQFAEHTVKKTYFCLCKGVFTPPCGELKTCIGRDPGDRKRFAVKNEGRLAHTVYNVVEQYPNHALCSVSILTGRTHQIRVHMSYLGHSIVGDPLYSRPDGLFPDATMMLHSRRLEMTHPITGERIKFESPLPIRFEKALSVLDGMKKA
jgi:23S rRNA pseudouridine1911/1915/1917 synthase